MYLRLFYVKGIGEKFKNVPTPLPAHKERTLPPFSGNGKKESHWYSDSILLLLLLLPRPHPHSHQRRRRRRRRLLLSAF